MPIDLPAYNYQNTDDQNLPPVIENQRTMPASPEQTNQFNPNIGNEDQLQQWLEENVYSKGWTVDYTTHQIVDPNKNYEVVGPVPTLYPMT